jgi:hypothetical protein
LGAKLALYAKNEKSAGAMHRRSFLALNVR